MAGNTIGQIFRLTTYGESHGAGLGGIVDGCPAGLQLDLEAVQNELDRRRPGQSKLVTPRDEKDRIAMLSGLFEGVTTGAPLAFHIPSQDADSSAYDHLKDTFRPSHADFTYSAKYKVRDHRGGGRSSARETVSRVAAGAIARQLLQPVGVEVCAYVERVQDIAMHRPPQFYSRSNVDAHPMRCPSPETAERMAQRVEQVREDGDTVGGAIMLVARGVPAGWGEPVFDKLSAELARALWSIPAVKAMEIGSGFSGTLMLGSQHNDAFVPGESGSSELAQTRTNQSGGLQGGLSNGQDLIVRIGFKPVATIRATQETVDSSGKAATVEGKGRHDPCVLSRAVPIVEAMALLVLADMSLRNKSSHVE
jgi:chorismate synthase